MGPTKTVNGHARPSTNWLVESLNPASCNSSSMVSRPHAQTSVLIASVSWPAAALGFLLESTLPTQSSFPTLTAPPSSPAWIQPSAPSPKNVSHGPSPHGTFRHGEPVRKRDGIPRTTPTIIPERTTTPPRCCRHEPSDPGRIAIAMTAVREVPSVLLASSGNSRDTSKCARPAAYSVHVLHVTRGPL